MGETVWVDNNKKSGRRVYHLSHPQHIHTSATVTQLQHLRQHPREEALEWHPDNRRVHQEREARSPHHTTPVAGSVATPKPEHERGPNDMATAETLGKSVEAVVSYGRVGSWW